MPPSLCPPDLFKHCLVACRLLRYMRTFAESLQELRLLVPETCWQVLPEALKSGPPVRSELLIAWRACAHVPLQSKVEHMVQVLDTLGVWIQPDWPRQGELWVRWGIDGVVRWGDNSYITLSVALTGRWWEPGKVARSKQVAGGVVSCTAEAVELPIHSRKRFGLAAILATRHESQEAIQALLDGSQLCTELQNMSHHMVVGGKHLHLRHFVMADHMCMWRLLGADHSCEPQAPQPCKVTKVF